MSVLSRNQTGALDAVRRSGPPLTAGWGGYSLATFRSLARRGLLSEVMDRRFTITAAGRKFLDDADAYYVETGRCVDCDAPVGPDEGSAVIGANEARLCRTCADEPKENER